MSNNFFVFLKKTFFKGKRKYDNERYLCFHPFFYYFIFFLIDIRGIKNRRKIHAVGVSFFRNDTLVARNEFIYHARSFDFKVETELKTGKIDDKRVKEDY